MPKVALQSQGITKKQVWKQNNVTSVVVSNLANTNASFIYKGVVRNIPAVDAITGVPVQPFEIRDYGNHFDIELNFNQVSNNILIDYTILVEELNDKC